MPPTLRNGKICYIEIPAVDIQGSADFYSKVFGWKIRKRGKASAEPGLLVYIMVDSVAATIESVVAHGGAIVQPIGADAPEITARFPDPAGNVIGLYQEPSAPGGGQRG
jgi:predicted enzyme related to lactoylglutathione lyase